MITFGENGPLFISLICLLRYSPRDLHRLVRIFTCISGLNHDDDVTYANAA